MTGYGKALVENENFSVLVEIKSLNNKGIDIFTKLPKHFFEEEIKIKNLVATTLVRGKISLTIKNTPKSKLALQNLIDVKHFTNIHFELNRLKEALGLSEPVTLDHLMRFPNAFVDMDTQVSEEEWQLTEQALHEAMQALLQARSSEGQALLIDLLAQIHTIEQLLSSIEPFEQNRILSVRQKLFHAFQENLNPSSFSEERFEQELFYYLEKFDINEEKVRLATHLEFFKTTIENETYPGKKLQFISQEIGREINTIGSKANDANIQKIVVEMKDALEKIKEQLNNVL